jgi:hypothetical protein
MTSTELELREALDRFLQATRERRPVEYVGPALDRVLTLATKIPPDADPMLQHYLERRSYQKAFDFLNAGVAETHRPQCGH